MYPHTYKNSVKSICLFIPVALIFAAIFAPRSTGVSTPAPAPSTSEAPASLPPDAYGRLPLSFELNQGQTDARVKFLARGQGYGLFLTAEEALFSFSGSQMRMRLQGAATSPQITGVDQLPGKVNYLLGNKSDKWRANVPTYARVRYEHVYPGVDLIYYGNQRQLEYDFVIEPGASFKQIRLAFDDAGKPRLNRRGDLILKSGARKITLLRPKAYQEIGNERREVPVKYLLKPRGQVAFQVGRYDKSQQLVIDPVLVYSTYLGGNGQDIGNGIATDSSGNAYITGQTISVNFPTGSPLQPANGGSIDAFVAKLNASGSAFVYSTFLGGSSTDIATSIAVDSAGNAFITGNTFSTDFPVLNALHPNLTGGSDAFITELNSSGSGLVYSTYLGGHSNDFGNSIAVDSSGNAYVTGSSFSSDFPTTNPVQANRLGTSIFKSTDGAGNWAPSDTGLIASGVSDFAFHPGNSSTIYAGTDAGVFKTTDGGVNWTLLAGSASLPVNKVAIDPTDPNIIYLATSAGLFKSTDAGNNFTGINNGFSPLFARVILVDPVTPTTLYALAIGSSVFKSIDGGANWTEGFINFSVGLVNGLTIDPNTPATLYASTTSGIFKSTNSGGDWVASNTGLPFNTRANNVVIDKTNNLLYAATNFGVFKSTNAAGSWTAINGNLTVPGTSVIALDPLNNSIIYISTVFGPQKTIDGGVTWNLSTTGYPNTTLNALVVNPTQPSTLFIGTSSGSDAFVTKLSAGGASQIYSTYLGGNLSEIGTSIALDAAGNAYLTGSTLSSNFPTANALQPVKAISSDAFVTKLNANGSALVYSTFLGGDGNETGRGIAVDASGNAYVTGTTSALNFPVVNAFQPSNAGFLNEGFVTKINAAGSALVYSTYLGGESSDESLAIAVDAAGSAYITGTTSSINFPTLGALQPERNGFGADAFLTKLAPSGSGLIHSTYLGGSGAEGGVGIALDSTQNIYIIGTTSSADFPTVNPLQPTSGGGLRDVFVAKLRPAPELEVTIADSPDPVNFGTNLTYTITVKNDGEVAATGVTLTDTLPAGAGLVSANSTAGVCTGTTSINCGIGTLNAGATATVTVVVTPPAVRTIVNTATVTLNETDVFLANNTATVETLVDFADLSIVKKAAQNLVAPGSTLTYSLIVKNKSGIPASVTVTDNLPAGTSFINCSISGNGACSANGNNVTATFSELAVGASESILLTVSVSGSATEGTVINNTASVSSPTPDPDTANNSATASVTVAALTVLQKSNGLIAFASNRNPAPSGIFTVKPDLSDEQLFPNSTFVAFRPVWSPDGTKLAFQSVNHSGNSPATEISVVNADGTGLLKLVNNVWDASPGSVSWSPNGSQIAYIGISPSPNVLDGIRAIHITNTDGSGTYRLPGSPSFLTSVDWSPDGTKFVYATDREIFVMNADGTGQTQLTTVQQTADGPTSDTTPQWSPDGTRILLGRVTNNFRTVHLMNADGSNLRKLFNFPATAAAWSGDGLSVVLEQFGEICTVNLDGTNFKCLDNDFFDASPNWQRLANPNPTPTPTPVPTFSLSGKFTSNTAIGVQVQLTGPVNAFAGHDASGNYEFVNLPAGEYTLTPVSIFHSFDPPSRTVTITNANVTGMDFVATFVPANITGHVKDNNGNPIPGIRVTSRGGFPEGSTFTDANGFYSFPNVQRNRTYSITVDPFTPYTFVAESQIILNLTKSEVIDFVGTKQPANVIRGRVIETITGQGIPGIQVSLAQGFSAAASTFTDVNGNFSFGERKSNNSYSVSVGPHQFFIFQPAVNAPNPFAQIQIPSLTTDQNLLFTGARRNTLQFSVAAPSVSEGSGSAGITITRTGDVISPATINFLTTDTAGLVACNVVNGKAAERCDYGTTAGTLRFGAGEASKTFAIPIVDDVHVEGNETFTITLSGPIGAQMGAPSTVTFTITDNDASPATQNPIDGIEPFVTQQYIDFLGRLPDPIGLANWVATLGACPNGGFGENLNPTCDRVHVSAGFFLSDEFRGRGYWAYRFYEVGFDRRPLYSEFVPDMAQVGGAQSPESELLSKAAFTDAFVQRLEFTNRYNGLTNAEYVNALEQNAEIILTNKTALVAALDANQKTRGQVLREIVESKAVEDQFFIRAFVAMQYFGYLRRDPDTIGYANWVNTLTADPSNSRHMIFGFLFSTEYRGRFGP